MTFVQTENVGVDMFLFVAFLTVSLTFSDTGFQCFCGVLIGTWRKRSTVGCAKMNKRMFLDIIRVGEKFDYLKNKDLKA